MPGTFLGVKFQDHVFVFWVRNMKVRRTPPPLPPRHVYCDYLLGLIDRFREHLRAVEKATTQRDIDQPSAISDHLTLPGHSLNNLELIPLELINSNRDAIRKAREIFLIYKGKTLEPSGMNRLTKFNPFRFRFF